MTQSLAIGDPQARAERFFAVLDAHGLRGADGRLRPDVQLVSMGDHFDIDVADRVRGRVDGVAILAWLAAHPREQVTILLGNHDAARVMELATATDDRFQEAAALGRVLLTVPRAERADLTAQFRARYPDLPTPGYAARDYNSFTVEQRDLVRALLRERRFDLATTAQLPDGTRALFTHAGVTQPILDHLALTAERDPRVIAAALQARLEAAIAAVEPAWSRGEDVPMSLAPLHIPGADGAEGGGLLYHRPADLDRPDGDRAWEALPACPRRYDPRDLPRGLVQVIGHTGHSKAYRELPRWREPAMTDTPGGLRTLRVAGAGAAEETILYRRGVHPAPHADADAATAAIAILIDPEMRHVDRVEDVALLPLTPG